MAQATKCTAQELENLAHWKKQGFRFSSVDPTPRSKVTPPSKNLSSCNPKLDAIMGLLITLTGMGALVVLMMGLAAGWARSW